MSLIEKWNQFATEQNESENANKFWQDYFLKEKDMYKEILASDEVFEGKIAELSEKFGVDEVLMTGFLDGTNDSLLNPMDLEALDEETVITLKYDLEKLYYNMVAAKAEWLYTLPEWNRHLTAEKQKELYRAQKMSKTVVKGEKIGRNDPCPCGSGKKYKKCCGR
ncbi:MAG: SEC-C domain-containing protein [Clostridia bacterium]|nr:SEC-C domain-containing protein [Clostridia bacterium]